jgi:drug/metabolite transporter (DMT)-like permease
MMSRGIWYMIISTFVFAVMNVFIKLVSHIPAVEVVFFRSVVSLVLSLGVLRYARVPVWGKDKKMLVIRGVAGACSLMLYFQLIQEVPLASATTILFLAPIFTSIIGIFFVKERVQPVQWLFFLVSFAGILMVHGFDSRVGAFYLAIGIASSLFSGVAYNCIRKMKNTEHPVVIIFYFPLVTLPITGAISAFNWVMPSGVDWLVLLMVGVLTQIAQYFMTKSYQAEELSKVASIRYLGIIYAIGFGYFIFDETFAIWAYMGMAVTIAGVVLNVWYKHKRQADDAIYQGKLSN